MPDRLVLLLLLPVFFPGPSEARPRQSSLVISTTAGTLLPETTSEAGPPPPPEMSRLHVRSDIQFRYAHTMVTSHVKNPAAVPQEVTFTVVLPDSAFISNFSMVLEGEEFVAKVKTKKEARQEYDSAVSRGRGAGLVNQDVRDSNTFTVSTNVEPASKVIFKLTYEELLERELGQYKHTINVNPGQVVDDLKIEVFINESLPISSLFVPELKESNEISFGNDDASQIAQVERDIGGDKTSAKVVFEPSKMYQREAGDQGLNGQLQINYDVDRNGQDSEVQVIDGYFVHFFAPENLPTLPKHVIFVLDVSGSMVGDKMTQLKDAMFTILDDMTDRDFFNIVTFSSFANTWQLDHGEYIAKEFDNYAGFATNENIAAEEPFVIRATEENKKVAIKYILGVSAGGGTNINDGLLEGLKIAGVARKNEQLPRNLQSIIVFLSDGQASSGVTDGGSITQNIQEASQDFVVPIYSLGFGQDADFHLINRISAETEGFSKQIYEGSDAAIQLENFFAQISSPLLANLKFDYVGGLVDNSTISKRRLHSMFKGGEYVVAGKLLDVPVSENDIIEVVIEGDGDDKYQRRFPICLKPLDVAEQGDVVVRDVFGNIMEPLRDNLIPRSCIRPSPPRSDAQNFLRKLHAFLNIKQLLKTTKKSNDDTDRETQSNKALKLALANNFVTELTSLVIVRPDEEPKIAELDGKEIFGGRPVPSPYYSSAPAALSSYGAPPRPAFRPQSYGAPPPQISSLRRRRPVSRRRPSPPNRVRIVGGPPPLQQDFESYSAPAPPPAPTKFSNPFQSLMNAANNFFRPPPVVTPPPITTSSIFSYENNTLLNLKSGVHEPCSGNLTMFSKTYYRGEKMVVTADTKNLDGFDNKMVSLKVSGDCCWTIFTDASFGGENENFSEGDYKSAVDLGKVLREGSSVIKGQRNHCHYS